MQHEIPKQKYNIGDRMHYIVIVNGEGVKKAGGARITEVKLKDFGYVYTDERGVTLNEIRVFPTSDEAITDMIDRLQKLSLATKEKDAI